MTKGQKIQLLLDYCERRDKMPNLLAALQEERPDQYAERLARMGNKPASVPVVLQAGA
jgi:hypothetical protein